MKRRTNLTLNPDIHAKAKELMSLLSHSDLTGFVEQLIREEYERRHGPLIVKDEPVHYVVRKKTKS